MTRKTGTATDSTTSTEREQAFFDDVIWVMAGGNFGKTAITYLTNEQLFVIIRLVEQKFDALGL